MSRTLPGSRRARVAICVLVCAALVLSVVFLVRWQRSVGHRAGAYADSLRDLPGVTSVRMSGDGDEPRDLAIHLRRQADRSQLAGVYDRLADLPDDVIDDVRITMGAVTVAAQGRPEENAAVQWALHGFADGTVFIDDHSGEISVRSSKQPAIIVAQDAVAALNRSGRRAIELLHGYGHASTVKIPNRLQVSAAHAALAELAPLSTSIGYAVISESGVQIQMMTDKAAFRTKVIATAQRAATEVDASGRRSGLTFSVEGPGGGPFISGEPHRDPGDAQTVAHQLESDGWTVRGIETDLSRVSVSKRPAKLADLATLRRDLGALRPALPEGAVITLQDGGAVDLHVVFEGTQADFAHVAPGLVRLHRDGYQVTWARRTSNPILLVNLPEHTFLGATSLRQVLPRLRALGWRGVANVVVHEHPEDHYHYGDPSVTFESTTTGRPSDVQITAGPGTELSHVSAEKIRSIWDAGAAP